MTKTFEITGVSTWNKGAELMLASIMEHFRPHGVRLCVDRFFGDFEDRSRYGLWMHLGGLPWGRARAGLTLLSAGLRTHLGLVDLRQVEALVDASGFAFGDQHPIERSRRFALDVEAARRAGRKVVLLPQAFGPFENKEMRGYFRRIVAASDLVFVRDDVSMEHVKQAIGSHPHVYQAPDFTNLLKVEPLRLSDVPYACIVPNHRMIEKARSQQEADAYLPLLRRCVEGAERAGLEPILLIHGIHDGPLAEALIEVMGRPLRVIAEQDALRIKAMLGGADLVIASRFHALVSALCQGVPALATSWSHKYEMLFQDYGCEELIIPILTSPGVIDEKLGLAVAATKSGLRARIVEHGLGLTGHSREMWSRVDQLLGLSRI